VLRRAGSSTAQHCPEREISAYEEQARSLSRPHAGPDQRNRLLAEMTDEVAELVLRHNYDQAAALGMALTHSRAPLPVHRALIADLERLGQLNRRLEALPTDEELDARAEGGTGLTAPEIAVLLAYVKIDVEREILDSALPDEAWTRGVLVDYFPTLLRARYAEHMADHPLRREIVTTRLVNEAVNRCGASFFYRAMAETAASPADVLRAYVVVRDVYGLPDLWRALESLDSRVPAAVQTSVYLEVRHLLDGAVRWLVASRRAPIEVPGEIERLHDGVSQLRWSWAPASRRSERASLRSRVEWLCGQGVPEDIADWATRVRYGFRLLDIVETAHASDHDANEVASIYFGLPSSSVRTPRSGAHPGLGIPVRPDPRSGGGPVHPAPVGLSGRPGLPTRAVRQAGAAGRLQHPTHPRRPSTQPGRTAAGSRPPITG